MVQKVPLADVVIVERHALGKEVVTGQMLVRTKPK
jgi:hypothetical protein